MIITLGFIGIFLISAVTLAIMVVKSIKDVYFNDDLFIAPTAFIILFGFAGLICGLMSMIENSTYKQEELRIEYRATVEQLNSTYEILENNFEPIAVHQYNESVKEFKNDIEQAQYRLSNPWIDWFTCCVYNEFDANAVQYYVVK